MAAQAATDTSEAAHAATDISEAPGAAQREHRFSAALHRTVTRPTAKQNGKLKTIADATRIRGNSNSGAVVKLATFG
jgi:hypothetical protein